MQATPEMNTVLLIKLYNIFIVMSSYLLKNTIKNLGNLPKVKKAFKIQKIL